MRRRRVYPELRRIEVIEIRYEAGRFERGFKAEPKSPASVRVVSMCEQVRPAITRQLPAGTRTDELVFPGPGGSNGIPHDLRHTFATWLEDAGTPSRVIDELMGHSGGRRAGGAGGSPMGRVYRETTPAMLVRVTTALDTRLDLAMQVAAGTTVRDRDQLRPSTPHERSGSDGRQVRDEVTLWRQAGLGN